MTRRPRVRSRRTRRRRSDSPQAPDGPYLDREIVHLSADGMVWISLELGHDFFKGHWTHLLALPQVYGTPRGADIARRPYGDDQWPEGSGRPGQGRSTCLTRPCATPSRSGPRPLPTRTTSGSCSSWPRSKARANCRSARRRSPLSLRPDLDVLGQGRRLRDGQVVFAQAPDVLVDGLVHASRRLLRSGSGRDLATRAA